jgi:hypothetical protein
MIQVALGAALLAAPEAPVVAATLAIVSGSGMVIAGTLVLSGTRTSWNVATTAFSLAVGAAAYVAWIAAPYWRAAAVVGALAVWGLIAGSTRRRCPALAPRSDVGWGGPG